MKRAAFRLPFLLTYASVLGKTGEEDADVERIINEMFDICSIVGKKMFDYGKLSVSK